MLCCVVLGRCGRIVCWLLRKSSLDEASCRGWTKRSLQYINPGPRAPNQRKACAARLFMCRLSITTAVPHPHVHRTLIRPDFVRDEGQLCCYDGFGHGRPTPSNTFAFFFLQDDDPFAVLRDLRFQIETVRWMVDCCDQLFDD